MKARFLIFFVFLPLLSLEGCAAGYLAGSAAMWGISGAAAVNGLQPNTAAGGPGDVDAYARKLMQKCYLIAYGNWALERPTLDQTYREFERTIAGGSITSEAKNAMQVACGGDVRTDRGLAIVARCTGETAECRAKKRLAEKTWGLINASMTPPEMDAQMAEFIKAERARFSQGSL